MIHDVNRDRLVKFAERIVGRQDAEDIVQDVYLLFLSDKVPTFRGESELTTWLFGIVKNRAYGFIEREKLRRHAESMAAPEDSVEPHYDEWLDTKAHLARLKPADRDVLVLYAFHGSRRRVAELLGLTRNQVQGRLQRARRRLKELMQ